MKSVNSVSSNTDQEKQEAQNKLLEIKQGHNYEQSGRKAFQTKEKARLKDLR